MKPIAKPVKKGKKLEKKTTLTKTGIQKIAPLLRLPGM